MSRNKMKKKNGSTCFCFYCLANAMFVLFLSGCKPQEEKLFEEGVSLYANIDTRKKGIDVLAKSGAMGCDKAYCFLAESRLLEATRLKEEGSMSDYSEDKTNLLCQAFAMCDSSQSILINLQLRNVDVGNKISAVRNLKNEIAMLMFEYEQGIAKKKSKEVSENKEIRISACRAAINHYKKSQKWISKISKKGSLENVISEIDPCVKKLEDEVKNLITEIKKEKRIREIRVKADECLHLAKKKGAEVSENKKHRVSACKEAIQFYKKGRELIVGIINGGFESMGEICEIDASIKNLEDEVENLILEIKADEYLHFARKREAETYENKQHRVSACKESIQYYKNGRKMLDSIGRREDFCGIDASIENLESEIRTLESLIKEEQIIVQEKKRKEQEERELRLKTTVVNTISAGKKGIDLSNKLLNDVRDAENLFVKRSLLNGALSSAEGAVNAFSRVQSLGSSEADNLIDASINKVELIKKEMTKLPRLTSEDRINHSFCTTMFGENILEKYPLAKESGIDYYEARFVNQRPFRKFTAGYVRASITSKLVYNVEFSYSPERGVPISHYDMEYESILKTLREKYGQIDSYNESLTGNKTHIFYVRDMRITFYYQTEGVIDRAWFSLGAENLRLAKLADEERKIQYDIRRAHEKQKADERLRDAKKDFEQTGGINAL